MNGEENGGGLNRSPVSTPTTPSLPQLLIPANVATAEAEEELDEDMATMAHLLLAMRHNAPTRNSNRSNASSQSSSQESALSSAIQLPGSHQVSAHCPLQSLSVIIHYFIIH